VANRLKTQNDNYNVPKRLPIPVLTGFDVEQLRCRSTTALSHTTDNHFTNNVAKWTNQHSAADANYGKIKM